MESSAGLRAIIIVAATVWVFQRGIQQERKSARAVQSVAAAARLLSILYAAKGTLRLLPYTEAAPGSPLSYGERGDRARPMLDEVRRAVFVEVPLLTDRELVDRFRLFLAICEFTASGSVDASEIHAAIKEADAYAEHLQVCLKAHIDETPVPADTPALMVTARAAEQQVIIASATGRGHVVTRD